MYKTVTIRDSVRIPPKFFGESLEESVEKALREKYEAELDKDIGVILSIDNCRDVKEGKIIPGDGSSYHEVTFDALTFQPKMHEVVRGEVNEITDFGAFIRFGPIDALAHVSQITDDYMSFNEKNNTLSGKETNRTLKEEDETTARVIAVSLKNNVKDSKINLTMKQQGLGKKEWIEEEKEGGEEDE